MSQGLVELGPSTYHAFSVKDFRPGCDYIPVQRNIHKPKPFETMKKSNQLLVLGAAFLLAPLTSTLAQSTWETVDVLTPWRGRDIVADSAGNFISLAVDNGTTGTTGVVSTAVSASADHGATWQDVGFIPGYAIDLTVAPDGALFATGNRSATVSGRAFCWQSLDHGVTWTVSDPSVGLATVLLVTDVAAGNTDSLYVCGTSSGRWMVRKGQRTPSGILWSTVDNPALSTPASIFVRPGTVGQPDEVLACGSGWTVRHSIDGGATWATSTSPGGTYASQNASSLAVGPDGSIYVAGRTSKTITTKTVVGRKVVTTTTTEFGGLIRRSTNGGATWADVDYVVNGSPSSIAVDAFGRVFAAGDLISAPQTWLVRGSTDGGATWITTDFFLPSGATAAMAWGIAADSTGNVCIVGDANANGASSSYLAPLRRLAAP